MTKLIEVVVAPNGAMKVETKGFSGDGCRTASDFLETALGVRTGDTPTAEFFQATEVEAALRQRDSV